MRYIYLYMVKVKTRTEFLNEKYWFQLEQFQFKNCPKST